MHRPPSPPDAEADRRLGEAAVTQGLLSEAQLSGAREVAGLSDPPRPLAEVLVELRLIGERELQRLAAVVAAFGAEPGAREQPGPTRRDGSASAPTAAPRPAAPRYDDVHEIDRGGLGLILEARDRRTHRRVALKVLAHDDATPYELAKFAAEAQITAQLEHPNIVAVHDVDRLPDGRRYFSMTRIHGRTLANVIDRMARDADARGRWPLSRLLTEFLKVCDGIAYAHDRGVVHRDLKPDNVMFGRFGEVLVLDWGLAKVLPDSPVVCDVAIPDRPAAGAVAERAPSGPTRTLLGMIIGTPEYMPPEQAAGRIAEIGPRSDIYSLGAMLYELLTLTPPFTGETNEDIIDAVRAGALEPPSQRAVHATVPHELEAVVLKAMALEPADRYACVADLEDDLRAYLDGRLVEAARYTPRQRAAKWLARHRLAVGATLALAIVIGGLLAGVRWRALRERRRRAASAVAEADQHLRALDALQARLPAAPAGPADPGRRPDPRLERALAACLAASAALETARVWTPADAALIARQREVTQRLTRLATDARDFTLARHAVAGLRRLGVADAQVARALAEVEAVRAGLLASRLARIDQIMTTLAAGSEPGWTVEDHVYAVAGFRDAGSLARLQAALDAYSARAHTRGAAFRPTPSERRQLRFLVGALGRSERAEAVAPLARWLAVVRDPELTVQAGLALCHTGRPAAYRPLVDARHRLGSDSPLWRRIVVALARVPEPATVAGAELTSVKALIDRGISRLDAGDARAAADDFARAVARAPRDPAAHVCLGNARLALKDEAGALAAFGRALALDPDNATALGNRGVLHRRAGDLRASLADLDRAVALAPEDPDPRSNRGFTLLELGRDADALVDFERALERAPQHRDALHGRGIAHHRLRHPAQALADLTRALQLDPSSVDLRYLRGCVRLQMLDYDGAVADLDRAIEIAPTAEMYANRGRARYRLAQYTEARRDLDRALALDPRLVLAWRQRGLVRMRQRDLAAAEQDVTRALRLAPEDVESYIARGRIRVSRRNAPGARADFDRAIRLDGRSADAYFNRGNLRQATGDGAGALADLSVALRLSPDNAAYLINRASLHLQRQDGAAATADARKAVRLKPRMWQGWANLAGARIISGDLTGAIEALEKAYEHAPPAQHGQLNQLRKLIQLRGAREGG